MAYMGVWLQLKILYEFQESLLQTPFCFNYQSHRAYKIKCIQQFAVIWGVLFEHLKK